MALNDTMNFISSNDFSKISRPLSPNISLPCTTSSSFPPSPNSFSCFSSFFSQYFDNFLREPTAVNAIWKIAFKEKLKDFPRHFYTLCSSSSAAFDLALLSLLPSSPLNLVEGNSGRGETCESFSSSFALENFLSYFLHSACHSYLHSSIGTFLTLLEDTLSSPSFSPSISSPINIHSLFNNSFLEQLLVQLINIILYSSPEIVDFISPTFLHLLTAMEPAPPPPPPLPSITHNKYFLTFFLKVFVCDFLCDCLEQPHIVLNVRLSEEVIGVCWVLGGFLRKNVGKMLLGFQQEEEEGQQHQQQQQQQQHQHQQQQHQQPPPLPPEPNSFLEDYTQKQLKKLGKYILWKIDDNQIQEGYENYFLPLWETHHLPCKRWEEKEKEREKEREKDKERGRAVEKRTCSMEEPSVVESFMYLKRVLGENMGELESMIEGVEVEVVRNLGGWMGEEENVAGFVSYFLEE